MNTWIVYILRCRNKSLYTGITKNLQDRIKQHNAGTGAKYTRANNPCQLTWSQTGFSESTAKKEEARIKKLTKQEKEEFITGK